MVQFVPHSKLKKSSENAEQEFLFHVFNQPWSAFDGYINFVGFDISVPEPELCPC
jgi:hypothetical protein